MSTRDPEGEARGPDLSRTDETIAHGESPTRTGGHADVDAPAYVGQIGRFIVLRQLGAGGMGVVYLAYDNALDRKVAVKVIRGLSPDPERALRLQREARAMAKVSHPNVLRVYEVGEHGGALFLAMEYVRGGSLRERLERHNQRDLSNRTHQEAPAWRPIVAIFVQAGRGLAAAHAAGLVHRDFKPDNVLVGDDGVARVADFGLARLLDGADDELAGASSAAIPASSRRPLDATITATRAVMGTPAYMSPEQHAGRPTDARTDQFSFCVALWEALYGARPFAGASTEALAAAIARGAPIAPPAGSRVPSWIRAALLRGLAVDPERRWPSMSALLGVLSDDPAARRRRRWAVAAGVAASAAAIVGLARATVEGQTQAEVASQRAAVASQRAEVASGERDQALELARREAIRARDSLRMLALRSAADDPTTAALVLAEVEDPASAVDWALAARSTLAAPTSAAVLRGHAHAIFGAAFVGDGDAYVATISVDRTARVWRADGVGDPAVRVHDAMLDGMAVAPDRRSFVALGEPAARLWAIEADGSMRERGAFVGDPEARTVAAAFSADGERLAVTDRAGGVWLWEVATGRLRGSLGGHGAKGVALAFDGRGRLLSGDDDGEVRVWDLAGGVPPPPQRLRGMIQAIAFGVGGRLLLAASDEARIRADDRSRAIALRGHRDAIQGAAVDPSGREFATASRDGSVRRWDVVTGAELGRLDHPEAVQDVAYSPDGRWLVTLAGAAVRLWRRDDPHVVHVLRGHTAEVLAADFSRDGARLVTASMDQSARVWRLDTLGEARLYRPPGADLREAMGGCDVGRVAALSDDGVLWVWDCGEPGPPREARLSRGHVNELEVDAAMTRGVYAEEEGVWEIDLVDLRRRKIGEHPRLGWRVARSPDGRHLVSTGYDRRARVWDLEGAAPPVVLVGHTSPVVWDAAWSPDGATIATIGNDTTVRIWSVGNVLSDTSRGPVELAPARVFTGHGRGAKTVAFAPDGRWVLTSSPDATARLWDPRGAAEAVVFAGHRGMIYGAAWSPDGARVATASEDGSARIWRVDAPAEPQVLRGHRGEVGAIAWSPDGRSLVTGSSDGTARAWSAEGGVATDVLVVGRHVLSARFTADGAAVVVAAEDDAVRLWRPTLDAAIDPAALMLQLRAATTACLTVRQREMILAEDEAEARARHGACEAEAGRSVDPSEGVTRAPPRPPPAPTG